MPTTNELTYDANAKLTPEEVTQLALAGKSDENARLKLVKAFYGYLDKYANILKGSVPLEHDNADTRAFKNLFISQRNLSFYSAARLSKLMRSLFIMVDVDDLRQDLIGDFLKAIENFELEKARMGFLPYVTQYIRWKAKDKVVAAMSQPLSLTNWSAVPMRGDTDFRQTAINPIDLPYLQKVEEPIYYDGLSEMNLEWVESCDDPLFRDLSSYSRYLLYLRFKCGQTFDEMASTVHRSPRTVSDQYKRSILRLRLMAQRDGAVFDPEMLESCELEDESE